MNLRIAIAGIAIILLGILGSNALFTVHETKQALVFQFGAYKRAITEPGLSVKVPFIQRVEYFERRVLNLGPPTQQVILADQKRLDVEAFARFRISDPLQFFQALRTETQAADRLSAIVNTAVRTELGEVTLVDILSEERAVMMTRIKDRVNAVSRDDGLGVEIVDVRIARADLPESTSEAIFARMRSERDREAAEARAQGEELARQIRSRADREKTVLLAEARREAQRLRGEGDQRAIQIYARAFDRDPAFFAFYRTMEAYRKALAESETALVLSPNSEFFRFFNDLEGGLAALAEGTPATAIGPLPTPAEMIQELTADLDISSAATAQDLGVGDQPVDLAPEATPGSDVSDGTEPGSRTTGAGTTSAVGGSVVVE